jgi:hypothetical protein
MSAAWLMRVERGLSAHFKQPDGSSRPGTDWSIGLKRGDETHTVLVRAYMADNLSAQFRKDTEYQARTAMQYLNDLLQKGWDPSNPGAPEITIANPPGATAKTSRWKFW